MTDEDKAREEFFNRQFDDSNDFKAREEFFNRQFNAEVRRKLAYAESQGFTVDYAEGMWRVYKPIVLPILDKATCLVASCSKESEAADVAYALAMLRAGACLPGESEAPK
jgi:hypothetical protein